LETGRVTLTPDRPLVEGWLELPVFSHHFAVPIEVVHDIIKGVTARSIVKLVATHNCIEFRLGNRLTDDFQRVVSVLEAVLFEFDQQFTPPWGSGTPVGKARNVGFGEHYDIDIFRTSLLYPLAGLVDRGLFVVIYWLYLCCCHSKALTRHSSE
jgi:hypothetical protein